MRRYSQNNDNRYYAYVPPTSSRSPQNSSSNSANQNAHYQYYDPRLRSQQQTQRALYEYQYSNKSPNRSLPSFYGSPRSQHYYRPPSILPELPPSSAASISDLGEPLSIFDDIKPLEYRRSIVAPSITPSYVPPDPSRRPSVSDVRLATAHVLREQLLTDIERTINDIDRDLTSLERRPSVPRYIPPRFSPIIELDAQDENFFRQPITTVKPVSVSVKKPIAAITSPVHKQIQQTSARSTSKERNSGSSQMWPNKPKRVYEVIPSLTSDSKKTSRQSSVGAQHEHLKISEIQSPQSPQSPTKTIEKHASLASIQFRGQYHYGPEVEEIEILENDPEDSDHKSTFDEMQDGNLYETLNTDQFLRDLSAPPHDRALIFVPEYGGNSQMGFHELTENIIENNQIDTNLARSSTATSLHDLTPSKELIVQDTESLIQTAPENRIDPEVTPRIPSRSTITPHELYHETEVDLRNENNPIILDHIKQSRPSTKTSITIPITTDHLQEKSSPLQIATNDSVAIVPSSLSPPPPTSPPPPPVDSNVSGLVAYFFSDFGNEGDGEEDISIDQSNFVVPTGAEIIADDDISSSLMRQSQASLLILHSAHVPRQQQQQQQHTSLMPSTIENNNEHIKAEEKEEIGSIETGVTNKRISTATSILPSSSPPTKQVLPTSIIDDMQTQFTRNNNTSNDDHHRQPSTTPFNMDTIDSNADGQEKSSNNSQIRLRSSSSSTSRIHSRIQSPKSERNNKQNEKNNEETRTMSSTSHVPLRNIDNERFQTPERIDSADQRIKSSSRTLTRGLSTASNHTKKDEEITHVDSPTKTALKNIDRENSTSQKSISHQPSITPSERSHSSLRRSISLRPSSKNHEISQSPSIFHRDQSNTSPDDIHKTPTNENEANTFSAESEHFLRNKSQTSPFDFNQRFPSGYSISHPNDSRRSSTSSSAIPVTLDSPDIDNNQTSTSRTATPTRKNSIASIDLPPDPNTLLTTTDEPDPDDPSIINSTVHFQMLSSQQPNNDISVPERNEPSPLVNIVPIQEFPSRVQSVELPSELLPKEEHSHEPSPILPHSPTGEIELEPTEELPPVSPESDIRLPSAAASHHEQEEPLHQTPSLSKNEHQEETLRQTPSLSKNGHQQESSRQSPILSYPARLEDLMRPTPSPFLSAHEHKQHQKPGEEEEEEKEQQQQEQKHNDRLSPLSPPINQTKNDDDDDDDTDHHPHSVHQNIPSKFEHKDIRSPLSTPRRSELSDINHTSVGGDDTYRQQLDSPSISPQNDQVISPDHDDHIDDNNNYINTSNNNNNHYQTQKETLISPSLEPTFITEKQRYPSSEKSASPLNSHYEQQQHEKNLHRNDPQLSSASKKFAKHHFSPSSSPTIRPTSEEQELPSMTASQQHSKLSLRLKKQEPKRKKSIKDQLPPRRLSSSSPLPQIDTGDITSIPNDDNLSEEKAKRRRQRRRVSFSSSIAHFQTEDRQLLTNWRERVAAILASKHRPNEKYAHIQSRVNSFANFEYQPKKIKVVPKKKTPPKNNERNSNFEASKFIKRKKFKVKKPKIRPETEIEEQTDDEQQQQHQTQFVKGSAPQLFGRLWCLPDGSPTVFHESLEWNVASKLKSYSYENLNYEPHRNDFKIYNKKPKWHSESKLAELIKESPRFFQRQTLAPITSSLPSISDRNEPYFYQKPSQQKPGTERKIYDIQTNVQQQSETRFQTDGLSHFQQESETRFQNDGLSHRSFDSKHSDIPIFNEKLIWNKQSKLKDATWENINYQPKKSNVQIFHKTVHWNSEPKIRTRSPSIVQPSRASMSNVQIFDEKLNWDAQAKVHCWSEIDLRQLTKKKAIFAQYHDPKWNDIVTPRIDATNYHYPKISNHVEIFSDRLLWTRNSGLKDYVWENFDYKTHRRSRQSNNQQHSQDTDQTPPNRPKWNAVSKIRSVNSVYNPKVTNSNMIRRGWDRELRRKRVHKLPPLKRKREREEIPQLAIDAPPSNEQLAIDYNYDHASTTQGRTTSNGYVTTSSRRSSKALVPLNHSRRFSELELPNETPRSQRPVQQEWYDEMNKSRLTHRADMGRITNHSNHNSYDSNHQPNTPRELATFRSSTRNSQNSVISGTLLDSSIRSNRATELRLSKDMDEHHQHSHTPSQSMPIEIRGFKLEGTQLTVPDHATIRPLSNVSYGASERVKSRRVYPWSSLHPHGTSSRNSSLVPIAEFGRPSFDTTINESQQLVDEE